MKVSRREWHYQQARKREKVEAENARYAFCDVHKVTYRHTTPLIPNRAIPLCPQCKDDERWMRKAIEQQQAEGIYPTYVGPTLAIAEKLAGREIKRYRHGR